MRLYDKIGIGYSRSRPPDARLVDALVTSLALPVGSTLLDVGAGTGKYSIALARRGYKMLAVEPSQVMRSQAEPQSGVSWIAASAERIPLPTHSADGAFIILALHHFSDRKKAFKEIIRLVGFGPIVVFTFEPSRLADFWLADYFPKLGREIDSSFSQLCDVASEVKSLTGRRVKVAPFLLPKDLQDKFAAACWARPEEYLDPEVRKGISSFSLMTETEVALGLRRLANDVRSGRWNLLYRNLSERDSYDAGYMFIRAEITRTMD